MKKVVILGERRAGLVEVPDPRPKEDWALVKIHAAPMCTEYKSFLSGERHKFQGILFLGHEAAGEVVEVAQPGRVKVGDRVVPQVLWGCGKCRYCVSGDYIYCEHMPDLGYFLTEEQGADTYAQYLLKPSWLLSPIPDSVSYERASLACCGLGPSFGAMQKMGVSAFDTILITGAGPVGLGAVVNAHFRGARVILVESVPYRVERAKQMGVAHILDPQDPGILPKIKELTGGNGVDCALDCAGLPVSERLCIDATRRRGRVAFVAECQHDLAIKVSPDMLRKGLTIYGSWHYNLQDFPAIMKVIQESPIIDLLISHILPMSRIQDAFELSAAHQTAKVILKPWE